MERRSSSWYYQHHTRTQPWMDAIMTFQLVLPSSYKKTTLNGLHNDTGHPGHDQILSLAWEQFWWYGTGYIIEQWIKECPRCLRRKSAGIRELLDNITSWPLELVCMDFLSLETSSSGYQHILVIADHFTRYAEAVPTRNQTTRATAVLFNTFIVHYWFPQRMHSDQGANFQSNLTKELFHIAAVEKSHWSVCRPMGNGMTECFSWTLSGMLGTIQREQKTSWHKYVAPLVHAYNCMHHKSTGYAPYYLFKYHPRLPIKWDWSEQECRLAKSLIICWQLEVTASISDGFLLLFWGVG